MIALFASRVVVLAIIAPIFAPAITTVFWVGHFPLPYAISYSFSVSLFPLNSCLSVSVGVQRFPFESVALHLLAMLFSPFAHVVSVGHSLNYSSELR